MATKTGIYIEGIGRRKTATARVRLTPATATTIVVNDKPHTEYFKHLSLQGVLASVLETENAGIEHYTITVKVLGGGISAQADAIRLGIARALVKEKGARRTPLKREGYLKRDPRSVERKKFGLRKARKRPAWSKR
ncbi:MAG TPA: 30S ribosomal protein S9 [Candidatus Paceibacterota bacterium]|nr:30S ribosomal protein S9 [Candidatus Paceibacterota bacterium]HMO82940.1 30S ribosomal protein S9 [Candidatus Paceibacterota bacterium]